MPTNRQGSGSDANTKDRNKLSEAAAVMGSHSHDRDCSIDKNQSSSLQRSGSQRPQGSQNS